jgi:hypothetical protein
MRPVLTCLVAWSLMAAALAAEPAPAGGRGFQVSHRSVLFNVPLKEAPGAAATAPVRIVAARNGAFSAQLLVSDGKPIKGLKVEASELKGPATLAASAVRVLYGVPDSFDQRSNSQFFDSLETAPPAEVPVYKEQGGSAIPLWVSVKVPADAKAGEYSGTLTVRAEGATAVSVPLTVKVFDWALPAPEKYVSEIDLLQSPESVAVAYDVPLWSEAHWKLLDRTFEILGPLADRTVYITCIRRTHFGNEHAMVRWVMGDDGEVTPDLSIAEKYLDVALKRLGRISGVILYCWEPPESQGHAGGAGTMARTADKSVLITLVNPQTGKLSARQGPAWDTPESKEFWKKLTDGMGAVLKKRGLENAITFGLAGDVRPTKLAMDEICNGVPGAKWAVSSHYYCDKWQGYNIKLGVALWGIGVEPRDPSLGYSFGWTNPFWLCYYPREMKVSSPLLDYRLKLETWMGGLAGYKPFVCVGQGPRGLGRIGVDFWPVLKDSRGRVRGSLAGRYPEAAWGQLNLNFCIPYLIGKGRDGPVPTVRSESLREGVQETEARIYIEKALFDDENRAALGEDLLGRCRTMLDERIRFCVKPDAGKNKSEPVDADWLARSEKLFGLAAELNAKYGGKEPKPNPKNGEKKK